MISTSRLSLPVFESLNDAFVAVLGELVSHGATTERITDTTSVGSRFGASPRATTELLAAGFSIANPRARWISSERRGLNRVFAVANTIWTFSGSDAAEDIVPYNARGADFARDGVLEGAVGGRIFGSMVGDQIATAIESLRRHKSSRRAVVHVLSPQDLVTPPLDTPCTISLQYIVREGRLDTITSMRSQSAALLLPYDVFLFSMLQEVVANELGVGLGTYHHFCGSLHYYDDEARLVQDILGECNSNSTNDLVMEAMPANALASMQAAICAERDMRRHVMDVDDSSMTRQTIALHPYWKTLLAPLEARLHERKALAS